MKKLFENGESERGLNMMEIGQYGGPYRPKGGHFEEGLIGAKNILERDEPLRGLPQKNL